METDQIVVLSIVGVLFVVGWIAYVRDKNQTIRSYDKALETFADLCPELRQTFGEKLYLDSDKRGEISLILVREYVEAKKAVETSTHNYELVNDIEERFKEE